MREGGTNVLSYLLTEGRYCDSLMRQGFRDAIARRIDICRFLDWIAGAGEAPVDHASRAPGNGRSFGRRISCAIRGFESLTRAKRYRAAGSAPVAPRSAASAVLNIRQRQVLDCT